jgi:hypothetical protein
LAVVARPVELPDDPDPEPLDPVTVAFEPLPYPEPGPSGGVRAPVATAEDPLLTAVPVAVLEPLVAEPDKLTDVAEDEAELLLLDEILAQDRSYKGVVLSGLPEVTPKDGLGVVSSVSSIVYQKMLTFPNLGHPT